eukprot:1803274-Amphidinium_carterae.1
MVSDNMFLHHCSTLLLLQQGSISGESASLMANVAKQGRTHPGSQQALASHWHKPSSQTPYCT